MDVTVRSVSESQSGLSDSWQLKKDGHSVLLSTIYKNWSYSKICSVPCIYADTDHLLHVLVVDVQLL